jgi:DNA-directed RNA polymerase specialized sigma24 family protein
VLSTIKAERVWLALDKLEENERTAICLDYLGNRSYREVARDLGVAECQC